LKAEAKPEAGVAGRGPDLDDVFRAGGLHQHAHHAPVVEVDAEIRASAALHPVDHGKHRFFSVGIRQSP
jgi:hypothetical protein